MSKTIQPALTIDSVSWLYSPNIWWFRDTLVYLCRDKQW